MRRRELTDLLEFLSERTGLSKDELPGTGEWAGSGNTIGSIALRMGLLSLEQIERIVDQQVAGDRRFGETAVALGCLTPEQVDQLIEIQELHRYVDVAGPIVLDDHASIPDLLRLLADYFEERGEERGEG